MQTTPLPFLLVTKKRYKPCYESVQSKKSSHTSQMLEGIGMNSKSTFLNKQSSLVYKNRYVELTGYLSGVNLIIPSVSACQKGVEVKIK